MKAIRIQVDMLYQVPEDESEAIYDFDVEFFHKIKEQMEQWADTEGEPRSLINAEVRHHMGDVAEQSKDEEDIPLDGVTPPTT
jgi:hypothetical protein